MCPVFWVFLPPYIHQGSILGPLLFSIYANNCCDNLSNALLHFYEDDTVIYCSSPSVEQTDKSKFMLFSNGKEFPRFYHCALCFITDCGHLVHHRTPSAVINTGWLLYINLSLGCLRLICVHTSKNPPQ